MPNIEAVPHYPEADTFDFQASLLRIKHAVWRYKLLVFCICFMAQAIVIGYMLIWPPVFTAEVVIAADSDEDLQRNAFYQEWSIFRKNSLSDETQFIISGPILKKVAQKMDLRYWEVYHTFLSYAVHLWGESWVGKSYRKIKHSIFPKKKSPYSPTEEEIEFRKTLKDFKKGVGITGIAESNLVLLTVKSSTLRVAEIANTIIDVYLEERINRFMGEAEDAYRSLSVETEKVHAELMALENKIKEYSSANGLLLLFEKDRAELSNWSNLQAAIVNIESVVARLENSLKAVESQLESCEKEITSVKILKKNNLWDTLTDLELGLIHTKQNFRSDSPEVLDIENEIISTKSLMALQGKAIQDKTTLVRSESYIFLETKKVQLKTELAAAKAELSVKKQAAAQMKIMLESIPAKMHTHQQMTRDQIILENKYTALSTKLTLAAVSKATLKSAPSAVWVVERATPPDRESWPKKKLFIAAATVMGLISGITAAIFLDIILARVTRYRLWKDEGEKGLYAIVRQDHAFVKKIFPHFSRLHIVCSGSLWKPCVCKKNIPPFSPNNFPNNP